MQRRRVRLGFLLAWVVALGGCATAPTAFRPPPPIAAAQRPAHNLEVFERSWRLVNEKYFDAKFLGTDWVGARAQYRPEAEKAADETALYVAINRMLGQLKESHLVALLPKSAFEFRTRSIVGIGIRMALADGRRVVTGVVPGSPAEAAGVKPGWLVLSRDGVPMDKVGPPTAEPGSPITFEFLDLQDQPRKLTISAAVLTFERREAEVLTSGVLWLRFDTFNPAAMSWLSRELKDHRNAPGVIVDLRQNPGGLSGVLRISLGEFFDRGVESGTFVRRGGQEHAVNTVALFSAHYTGPMVVLVDRLSASSAEIFAHVVQHHRRATIIGRKTAGAVMAARFYSLPGGGQIEIPVEDYVGLDGQRLEGRGVTPDLVIAPATLADWRAGRDPDVEAALTELRKTRLISSN